MERSPSMRTLSLKGMPAMVRPFFESTINLDKGHTFYKHLGSAADNENIEVSKMLLAAGASSARAVPLLFTNDHMNFQTFKQLLNELLENLSSIEGQVRQNDFPDALIAIIQNHRAVSARPDAPKLLLRNRLFVAGMLRGSNHVYACHSYMLGDLHYNHVDLLEGLLGHGPPLDRTIPNMFTTHREHFQTIAACTWLTLAVELGRPDGVRLVLAHTAHQEHVLHHPDGAG